MLKWLSKAWDRRASWSAASTERSQHATPDAPVAWIARSVLEGIERSAEYGLPRSVDGELLGYWVTPNAELVVVDWSGFGAMLAGGTCSASASIGPSPRVCGPLESAADALRMPLGVWSTRPVARADMHAERSVPEIASTHATSSTPLIHLLLERHHGWRARLLIASARRWPWNALRRPRGVELRVFSAPRT